MKHPPKVSWIITQSWNTNGNSKKNKLLLFWMGLIPNAAARLCVSTVLSAATTNNISVSMLKQCWLLGVKSSVSSLIASKLSLYYKALTKRPFWTTLITLEMIIHSKSYNRQHYNSLIPFPDMKTSTNITWGCESTLECTQGSDMALLHFAWKPSGSLKKQDKTCTQVKHRHVCSVHVRSFVCLIPK